MLYKIVAQHPPGTDCLNPQYSEPQVLETDLTDDGTNISQAVLRIIVGAFRHVVKCGTCGRDFNFSTEPVTPAPL